MAKLAKLEFVCTDCGMNYPRWQGQCRCGAWNTLTEMKIPANQSKSATKSRISTGGYAGGTGGGSKKINEVESTEAEKQLTGIGELDRVLCGGVTTGSSWRGENHITFRFSRSYVAAHALTLLYS